MVGKATISVLILALLLLTTPSSSLPLISDPTCTPFYCQGRVDAFHVQREEVLSWSTCTISPAVPRRDVAAPEPGR
ncbi:hypothetical protein CK203_082132 [Vitis vinifera]|uniref:Secreted protein n=1 Tax=Vitis vinifera TaxID=29760 RepID=A0A438CMS6_VITVI|nr:hypothetical protein CK203_082132 [Vitis vinifera]